MAEGMGEPQAQEAQSQQAQVPPAQQAQVLQDVTDPGVASPTPSLLADLYERAALIDGLQDRPLSVASCLLALFAGNDSFCRWLRRTGAGLGQRLQRAANVGEDAMAAARKWFLDTERFVRVPDPDLFREWGRIASVIGRDMSSQIVFAAYCFGDIGHEDDFEDWQFDRTRWTRRLLAWVAMRRPAELSLWLDLVIERRESLAVWGEWLTRTGADESGARDAASVMDGLAFRSETPNLGDLASSRNWSPTGRSQPSEANPSQLQLTDEVEHWADLAHVIALPERPFPDAALVAAAVAAPPDALPGVSAWFEARGTSLDDEAAALWDWAANNSATSSGWSDVRQIWAEMATPALAGFDNDEARGGVDRLGFKRDVAALAQLLAASEERGIRPPLAVGLFGDWGTGKTFFMDMLQRKIDELKKSGEPAFCQRIIQIRFNAWHYMDANLWASLAVHLFGDLQRQLEEKETPEQKKARTEQELASARTERERLEGEKASLEKQLGALRELATGAEKERESRRLKLADLRAADFKAVLAANPDLAEKLAELDRMARATSTLRGFFSRYTVGFLVVTFAALAAGLYAGSAVLSQLATTVGGIFALVSGVVGAVRRAVPRSAELIQLFQELEARARSQRSDQEERLGQEIAAADVRFQELVGACTRLATDVARLEAEKQRLAEGRDFARYVLQRSQSDDYRKQLGIVSTLQRDFDELSQRLLVDDAGARVQRIVLYIDDLDRCPADKVVQVLQAVHLLLSFPLFVVVVAVDPTWVLRSLEEHYVRQMGGDGAAARIPAATPHAYLEKIFQIPVRVRPMGTAAYQALIDGMAGHHVAAPETELPDGPADRDISRGDERDEPVDAADEAEPGAAPVRAAHNGARPAAAPEPELTGEALTLETRELDYMKLLGPLVPTPRAAKRLINVYRLIRVQLTPGERLRFIREEDGTFHALMLFLALNARFPEEALALFDRVERLERKEGLDWSNMAALAVTAGAAPIGSDWSDLWSGAPTKTASRERKPLPNLLQVTDVREPLERLTWRQIAHAAALAARYSLPGARDPQPAAPPPASDRR